MCVCVCVCVCVDFMLSKNPKTRVDSRDLSKGLDILKRNIDITLIMSFLNKYYLGHVFILN